MDITPATIAESVNRGVPGNGQHLQHTGLAACTAAMSGSTAACEATSASCNVTSCAITSILHASQITTMKASEYLGPIYSTQQHAGIPPAGGIGGGSRSDPGNGQLLHHTCPEGST